jgi:gas vesicle protein
MKTGSKLFSAFLLGAATGALLAPEKGSELRKKLSKNANNLLDQLQDTIADGKEKFDDLKEKIVNKASALKEEMAEAKMEFEKQKRKAVKSNGHDRKNARAHASGRSR